MFFAMFRLALVLLLPGLASGVGLPAARAGLPEAAIQPQVRLSSTAAAATFLSFTSSIAAAVAFAVALAPFHPAEAPFFVAFHSPEPIESAVPLSMVGRGSGGA